MLISIALEPQQRIHLNGLLSEHPVVVYKYIYITQLYHLYFL